MTEHDLTFRFYLRDDWSVSLEKLVRDSTEAQPRLDQGSPAKIISDRHVKTVNKLPQFGSVRC